jgi:hypothetical protein
LIPEGVEHQGDGVEGGEVGVEHGMFLIRVEKPEQVVCRVSEARQFKILPCCSLNMTRNYIYSPLISRI